MGLDSLSTPRKVGAAAAFLTALGVALAYQLPATLDLQMGSGLTSSFSVENFHDAELGYRWSRGRSRLVFHDPGTSGRARLELTLAGFRPRGQEPPLVLIEAGGERLRLTPSRRIDDYTLEVTTSGVWSSDLTVEIRSETFSPGAFDERALGVRVHRARLILDGAAIPPVRQMLLSALVTLLLFALSGSRAASILAAPTIAASFALFRGLATLVVPALAASLIALALARWLAPSFERFVHSVLRDSVQSIAGALKSLWSWAFVIVSGAALVGVVASYWSVSELELDIGSGRPDALTRRFGAFDQEVGVSFRRARTGAALDLRDFGAGGPWTVEVHASLASGAARGLLIKVADAELVADVSSTWNAFVLELPRPSWGWHAGHRLELPGLGAGNVLRIDRVLVDRGRAMPSLKTLATVLAAGLLIVAALLATGLRHRWALVGAGLYWAAIIAGLALDPVLVTPFLETTLFAAVAGLILAALTRSFLDALEARDLAPALSPLAVAVAVAGFVLAFLTTASPLYKGGHFGFHTAIAEEIWHGRFLLYYLPFPGSMLSRQPQWANLIVPHSCLYHILTSPFALFPTLWFALLTKLFLAALLFGVTVTSALVATRVGDVRAGVGAALAAAFLPIGYQLLGLGHLMTLFGTWAGALALGFTVVHVDRLSERAMFWCATALWTLCCLSYTGSLLFASLAMIGAISIFAWRRQLDLGKRLAALLLIAWGMSFVLYYIHWALPFVTESLPELLTGFGSDLDIDVMARLATQPRKLAYTFGAWLIPVVGLLGVTRARPREARALLYSWGAILVGFAFLDSGFNFLLKHHYFTYPAIAVGLGLVLEWLSEKNFASRVILALLVVSIVWMGSQEALTVARGGV